ncbi:tryptophan N-monooxygenase CYP79A68-like [Phoenix dactylifera]|uniref:Tryptophan N-monooxygenase CYP79A68-like n=1 Tax=Phoenix dactylifera TaxID=42345 RepID=A0A8B7CXP8_PHODC|nr:tryptophan N-monooxygenase CYP79A68-like [Phoenix dactylifera]
MGMPSMSQFTVETLLSPTLLFLTFLFFFFLLHPSVQTILMSFKDCRLPPGSTSWTIFGSLLTMLRHKPHFRWILKIAEGKDITCIRLGSTHVIVVNSPELSREFLKKQDANFASRPLTMATEYSGRNFLSVVIAPWGEQWKKMRRVVASEILNTSRLHWQSKLRTEEIDHIVKYIHNQCEKLEEPVINVRLATRYYTGNTIRRMIFGVRHFGEGGEYGGPGKEELEHVDAAFKVLSFIYAFCASDFMPWLRWLDIDGHERNMKEAIRVINKYHDPIIEERMQKWRGEKEKEVKGAKREVEDLLDVFISLKDNKGRPLLTMEEVKAQCQELVFATVDNPSNIAEWSLAELLNRPEILQKAMEELDRVVGKDRLLQESDLPQLPYLRACAREGLRLHPVAPFNLPHVALADATVANYFIPKGSQVLLNRVGLGRNEKVWDDAPRFNPDRHLKNGSTDVGLAEPDLLFISFGTGRRGCMGGSLGSVMTYMLLGRLLQAFDWSLAPGELGVDLSEDNRSLFMARPFHACAKPRLAFLANL